MGADLFHATPIIPRKPASALSEKIAEERAKVFIATNRTKASYAVAPDKAPAKASRSRRP
jgi:hypothetical protein